MRIDHGNEKHTCQRRKGAHRCRADAKERCPHFEQPVIAGGVDIGGGIAGDARKGALDQGIGVAFVAPKAGAIKRIKAQGGGDNEDGNEPDTPDAKWGGRAAGAGYDRACHNADCETDCEPARTRG